MSTLLIQNGTVVDAGVTAKADLLIDGATIKEVRGNSGQRSGEGRRRRGEIERCNSAALLRESNADSYWMTRST